MDCHTPSELESVVTQLLAEGIYARLFDGRKFGTKFEPHISGGICEASQGCINMVSHSFVIEKKEGEYSVKYSWPGQVGHTVTSPSLDWLVSQIPLKVQEHLESLPPIDNAIVKALKHLFTGGYEAYDYHGEDILKIHRRKRLMLFLAYSLTDDWTLHSTKISINPTIAPEITLALKSSPTVKMHLTYGQTEIQWRVETSSKEEEGVTPFGCVGKLLSRNFIPATGTGYY